MSSATHVKTSLEWFFKNPSAANFPQATASNTLLSLQSAYSKLIDSLFLTLGNGEESFVVDQITWVALVREAIEFAGRFRENFNATSATSLVSILDRLGNILKEAKKSNPSQPSLDKEWLLFRNVLSSLILYAKESKDFSFKNNVLALVKNFEQ